METELLSTEELMIESFKSYIQSVENMIIKERNHIEDMKKMRSDIIKRENSWWWFYTNFESSKKLISENIKRSLENIDHYEIRLKEYKEYLVKLENPS